MKKLLSLILTLLIFTACSTEDKPIYKTFKFKERTITRREDTDYSYSFIQTNEYDKEGRCVRRTVYADSNKKDLISRWQYIYSDDDSYITKEHQSPNSDPTYVVFTFFNRENEPIKTESYIYSKSTDEYTPQSYRTWDYSQQGKVCEISYSAHDNKEIARTEKSYDRQCRIIRETTTTHGVMIYDLFYEYGENVVITKLEYDKGKESKQVETQDYRGRILSVSNEYSTMPGYIHLTVSLFDENDMNIGYEEYSNGELYKRVLDTFDENGKITGYKVYDKDGNLTDTVIYR